MGGHPLLGVPYRAEQCTAAVCLALQLEASQVLQLEASQECTAGGITAGGLPGITAGGLPGVYSWRHYSWRPLRYGIGRCITYPQECLLCLRPKLVNSRAPGCAASSKN